VTYWLLLRYGPRGAEIFFVICLVAGCLATTLTRFDILPAALTLLCLILAQRRHWSLAYIALALGVLIKLYPIVLFPILFLAEQQDQAGFYSPDLPFTPRTVPVIFLRTIRNLRKWRWKNGLLFIGLVLGVTVCFGVLVSKEAFSSFSFLDQRPFQIESIGSMLLWMLSFLGIPVEWKMSFGSLNTLSPIEAAVSQALLILLCLGFIYILIQQWKKSLDLVQAALAALLLLVATSKVFSPQYLIWVIPVLALGATGNRKVWIFWGGISILTTLIFPVGYILFSKLNDPSAVPGFLPTILLRDVVFLLLAVAYLFNFLNLREPTASLKAARPVDQPA
jgi:hypothetical protein